MGRCQTWVFSFLLGAIVLCCLSLFQKLAAGYMLAFRGFFVPFWAGGSFGLLIGMRNYRLNEAKNKLQKACDELEHRVKERTAELMKTNEQLMEEIDERKRAEETLRESEERYRLLSEECPISIMMFDDEGKVTFVNDWHLKTFARYKHDADFFVGKKISELPGIVKAGVAAELEKVVQGKHVILEEVHFPEFTGGHSGYQSIKAAPVYKEGDFAGGILIRENVTERKHAEVALRESEVKYRSMMEAMKDPAYICSPDFHIEYMNQAMINRTGCDATGESCFRAIHHLEEKCPWCMHDKAQQGEHFEHEILSPNDNCVYHVVHSPIVHANGSISKMAVFRDITELKSAEESVLQSEKRFRNLFESITDLIYTQDLDGRFISVNPAMHRLFGYDMDGFIGHRATDFMKPELRSSFDSEYLEELKSQGRYEGISSYLKKDGSKIYIEYRSTLVKPYDGDPFISGMGRDVTERVLSEKNVAKLKKQLVQLQKIESIGTLAGGIAHDFNNILFPMFGYLEMMLEDVPESNPLRSYLEEVFNGSKRARDLVQQILTFSRQSDRVLKPLKSQLVIKEALKLIRSSLPSTININQNIDSDCGLVMADPTQIHQIVMNLCTNAFHAMEKTGGKLTVNLKEVELTADDVKAPNLIPGGYVCLTVADTGTGIEQSVMDRMFDPYFTTKKSGKGTGLGLAVTHGVIKDHGGYITVDSEPGKGTEFKVYLPAIRLQETAQSIETDLPIQKGNERILLVDDEKVIAQMIQQTLERLGYHVTARNSSTDALEAFRTNPDKFDLVITDLTMPNLTGDKLAVELIKIRSDIPVIV